MVVFIDVLEVCDSVSELALVEISVRVSQGLFAIVFFLQVLHPSLQGPHEAEQLTHRHEHSALAVLRLQVSAASSDKDLSNVYAIEANSSSLVAAALASRPYSRCAWAKTA